MEEGFLFKGVIAGEVVCFFFSKCSNFNIKVDPSYSSPILLVENKLIFLLLFGLLFLKAWSFLELVYCKTAVTFDVLCILFDALSWHLRDFTTRGLSGFL